jgi:SAM-dependent methyltransferase
MVDPAAQKRYWKDADGAHRDWQVGPGWFADTERALLESAGLPDRPLLEIGCGAGANLEHLGARRGSLGVDSSPGKLAQARAALPRVGFVRGDAAALPVADASFDAVLVRDVLHHVVDRAAVLAEAARVLRPGGALAVIEPNRWSPLILAQAALIAEERGALAGDAARLRRELAAAGLTDVVVRHAQPLPLARVVTHPRLPLGLGFARGPLGAVERLAGRLLPRAAWMVVVARARRP